MSNHRVESLRSIRDHYAEYHHHKEVMGYGAAVLYLTAAAALILASDHDHAVEQRAPFLVVASITAVFGFVFVVWQLRNRRIAAAVVEACNRLMAGSFNDAIVSAWDMEPRTWNGQSLPHVLVDEVLAVIESGRGFRSPLTAEVLIYLVMGAWLSLAAWTVFH